MTPLVLFTAIALALSLAMAGAWTIARRPGNSGWTDAIWSWSTAAAGLAIAIVPAPDAPGPRAWLVAALVAVWGLRLGSHIAVRSADGADDPRYVELKREWGTNWQLRLFLFLQIQAACGWLLALAVRAAAHNPAPFPAWSDWFGTLLLAGSISGEALADHQLRRFRLDPANRGKVCTAGLWGLSRHPNYFFEWLVWLSYAVIAIGPGGGFGGWTALVGPVLMYVLLVHLSGIPPLEAHMLRSRGEAFREVQDRISAFWPIPKR